MQNLKRGFTLIEMASAALASAILIFSALYFFTSELYVINQKHKARETSLEQSLDSLRLLRKSTIRKKIIPRNFQQK